MVEIILDLCKPRQSKLRQEGDKTIAGAERVKDLLLVEDGEKRLAGVVTGPSLWNI